MTLLDDWIVFVIAVLVAALVGWEARKRRLPRMVTAARIILVLYLGWLVAATLFPIPLHAPEDGVGLAGESNHPNLVPLAGIRETLGADGIWPRVRLLAGNVLVFVPFGLLLPVALPRLAATRRILLAGLLLSVGIELAQLCVSLLLGIWYRMSDVDDVLLNVVGVTLGWAILRRAVGRGRPPHADAPSRRSWALVPREQLGELDGDGDPSREDER